MQWLIEIPDRRPIGRICVINNMHIYWYIMMKPLMVSGYKSFYCRDIIRHDTNILPKKEYFVQMSLDFFKNFSKKSN